MEPNNTYVHTLIAMCMVLTFKALETHEPNQDLVTP
jgi:hypothetical protein